MWKVKAWLDPIIPPQSLPKVQDRVGKKLFMQQNQELLNIKCVSKTQEWQEKWGSRPSNKNHGNQDMGDQSPT